MVTIRELMCYSILGAVKEGKKEDQKSKKKIIKNYLSDTDPEDYVNHPKLPLDPQQRKERIMRLWRSCFNCSIGVAIMLK